MSTTKQVLKQGYLDNSLFFNKHNLPMVWTDGVDGKVQKVCQDCKQWVKIDAQGNYSGNLGINCNKPTKET